MNSPNPDPSETIFSRLRAKRYGDLPKATEIDVKRSLCQICGAREISIGAPGPCYIPSGLKTPRFHLPEPGPQGFQPSLNHWVFLASHAER